MTTNKFNIPGKFTNLVEKHVFEPCKDLNRYSISKLLGNVRENVLNERFEGDEDVSDRVPALLGTMMHYYFENKVEGGKHETKLEAKLDCYTIVGILDCYEGTKIIDYKLKKANDFNYDDHIKQIKLYAWLARRNGIYIDKGEIDIIRKDWSKIKCPETSPIEIVEFDITYDDIEWAEDYIFERIHKHEKMREFLEPCSNEDKWYTGTKYAVMKEGRKTAIKVYDEYPLEIPEGTYIEERKGINLKCEHYCKMCKVCKYYDI